MTVDLSDVQGNVVRGYGLSFDCARHVAVGIGDGAAASARAFIRELVDGERGDGLEVTPGDLWNEAPSSCLNVAVTWPGLRALGVPEAVLAALPAEDPADDLRWLVALTDAIGATVPEPADSTTADVTASGTGLRGALALLRLGVTGVSPQTLTIDGRAVPATATELALAVRAGILR